MNFSSSQQGTENFWNKFKASTKSLSTSFAGLSVKEEKDGDTPDSTVVHKALVNFYSRQEPFTGFPGWLGERQSLPNEQKLLRKQERYLEKQHSRQDSNGGGMSSFTNSIDTFFKSPQQYGNATRSPTKYEIAPEQEEDYLNDPSQLANSYRTQDQVTTSQPQLSSLGYKNNVKQPEKRTAGMSFHNIYKANDLNSTAKGTHTTSSTPNVPTISNPPQRGNRFGIASPPERAQSSSSLMMRDRLKKTHTKSNFDLQ